ncbi:hypothetical protein TRAPUB_13440 [Trametes pubescens]|uniref:TM7S3/TM198-like domain-containing protein n=1 Tax=Trametes pubescens TaxID=154538 RepID=A0A1M2VR51_TRAPU|nr:hypothetical protein TRAPUB_13440 [Trametes pubescens]
MPVARSRPWPSVLWPYLFVLFTVLSTVLAQSATSSATGSVSLSLTTGSTTITTTTRSGNLNIPTTVVVPTVFNVTITPTQSASSTTSAQPSATTSAAPDFTKLDTHLDPGFGVLGALLILTGLPSAFLGHKNRWSSFFLIGFYTLSLTCFVLILRFGVLNAINPPNTTLRGLFVLSCGVAGIAGGGISIFFWKAAKYFTGAWGGFAFALWIQCFRNGGLIAPIGFRWIMYIAISVVGFVLCTIPKLHYYIMLTSTAFVGATAFMLGVDCFTTAGLKEFYVWNIGFQSLFTKYQTHGISFPVTQIMQIELGMMGAVSLMGIAVQFQILKILQRKLKEIEFERKKQNDEADARAAERFRQLEAEKEDWALAHPTLPKHDRSDSGLSGSPLLGKDGFGSPYTDSPMGTPRPRYHSGLSEFMAAPTPTDELNRAASKQMQTPGVLPALDLGDDIEANVPKTFIADDLEAGNRQSKPMTPAELEDFKRRQELLTEINTIRKSIELLRSDTPVALSSNSSESRHQSGNSRQLSQELGALPVAPAHLRPPRQRDPRARVQSMELSTLSHASDVGASIGRPTSAPLRDDDWDVYLHERKLLQPPAGVTPPIPTTAISPTPRIPVSPAVVEALKERRLREDVLSPPLGGTPDMAAFKDSSSEDIPLALRPQHHKKTSSQGGQVPVTILPPKRLIAQPAPKAAGPSSPRVKTFEELVERHREKLRELQAPLTQAEQEAAQVNDARGRWERAKNAEKQAMAKRQAEKEQAAKEKARKSGEGRRGASGSGGEEKRHTRSLSADVLANVPGTQGSSRRMSTMKVEDWQRHQVDVDDVAPTSPRHRPQQSSMSMARRQSGVPFPERRMSSMPRDPVS